MTESWRSAGRHAPRVERTIYLVFWSLLAVSWVVAAIYMWHAVATIPSAEHIEASRLVGPLTPRMFVTAVIFSGMELGIVLAALWPWKPEYYASRLCVAGLALVTWFIMTTPMDLTRLDWVHRCWLAFMISAVAVALLGLLAYRAWRRFTRLDGDADRAAIVR